MAKGRNQQTESVPGNDPGTSPLLQPPPHGQHMNDGSEDLLAGQPHVTDAHMAETHPVEPERPPLDPENPPPIPPGKAGAPNYLASASAATTLPNEGGRFIYHPPFGPDLELDEATGERIDDLAMEILKANPNVAVDPKGAGADAYDRAVAIVTSAIDAGREHVMEKNSAQRRKQGDPAELKRQASIEERRKAAYLGADLAANPRAYARDPNDPSDTGPAEPMPIDHRAIADEQGRRVGAFPALA